MVLRPLFVKRDQVFFQSVCGRCLQEKNDRANGRGWWPGESMDDITTRGRIEPEMALTWVVCPYGHRRVVLREGTEPARNFR